MDILLIIARLLEIHINMSIEQRNDDLLFTITQQTGQGVNGLLDAVFGFLQRRTDFFYEMEPGDKMGFAPGAAESMVSDFLRECSQL